MFFVADCKLHCESPFVPHVMYFVFCLFHCICRWLIADLVELVCVAFSAWAANLLQSWAENWVGIARPSVNNHGSLQCNSKCSRASCNARCVTEARHSVPNIWRDEERKHMFQHRRASDDLPRRLQDEMRQTPVDKDSARLLEQDMKKRQSMKMIFVLFCLFQIFRVFCLCLMEAFATTSL